MSGEITGKPTMPDTVLSAPLDNGTGIALQFLSKGQRSDVLLMDPGMATSVLQAVATALSGLPGEAGKPPEKVTVLPVKAAAVRAAPGAGCQVVVQLGRSHIALDLPADVAKALGDQLKASVK